MWYPSTVTVAPTTEPVTLDQVKQHLRVDHDLEDVGISGLIAAARDHVERYCNVRFAEQTVMSESDSFADFARLSEGPLKSVTSISYVDAAGEVQTLDASVYEAHKTGLEPSIGLKPGQTWPNVKVSSRITLTAVYGGNAPKAVVHAILLFVGAWYENREQIVIGDSVSALAPSVATDALLSNFRRGV